MAGLFGNPGWEAESGGRRQSDPGDGFVFLQKVDGREREELMQAAGGFEVD